MTPLEQLLLDKIERSGPMPFAAYMSLALYHPEHGYYTSGRERAGWGGHFITSPELHPLYGSLWAAACAEVWRATGSPDDFVVFEIGPGEGGFAAAILQSATGGFADSLRIHLIERSAQGRERQAERLGDDPRVSWSASVPETPGARAGLVFANEVLDNQPVHLVEVRDGVLKELCVAAPSGDLELVALAPSSDEAARHLERCGVAPPEGHRLEIGLASEALVKRAAGLVERGAVVFVDYGDTAEQLALRPAGTLVAYSKGSVDDDVLRSPGERDITAHANWTAVSIALEAVGASVVGPVRQAEVLRALGMEELNATLREKHARAVGDGLGAGAVAALSARQALGALVDPDGLGGLQVVVGLVGIARPQFLNEEGLG